MEISKWNLLRVRFNNISVFSWFVQKKTHPEKENNTFSTFNGVEFLDEFPVILLKRYFNLIRIPWTKYSWEVTIIYVRYVHTQKCCLDASCEINGLTFYLGYRCCCCSCFGQFWKSVVEFCCCYVNP